MVDRQTDGGDGGVVHAPPWVKPGDVGGAWIDAKVTVSPSLHRRTGL